VVCGRERGGRREGGKSREDEGKTKKFIRMRNLITRFYLRKEEHSYPQEEGGGTMQKEGRLGRNGEGGGGDAHRNKLKGGSRLKMLTCLFRR
jgi:hypothetical protein